MYQHENEGKNQSLGSFWNLCMMNEPILQCIIVLRAWFVCHRLYPERTKTFVFGFVFVFVLAHEQSVTFTRYPTLVRESQIIAERRRKLNFSGKPKNKNVAYFPIYWLKSLTMGAQTKALHYWD